MESTSPWGANPEQVVAIKMYLVEHLLRKRKEKALVKAALRLALEEEKAKNDPELTKKFDAIKVSLQESEAGRTALEWSEELKFLLKNHPQETQQALSKVFPSKKPNLK